MLDVVDEFVGFLKNLPFVFAREVVKTRVTKHLESRRRSEAASERASEQKLRSDVSTHWFPDGDHLTQEGSRPLG